MSQRSVAYFRLFRDSDYICEYFVADADSGPQIVKRLPNTYEKVRCCAKIGTEMAVNDTWACRVVDRRHSPRCLSSASLVNQITLSQRKNRRK